MTMYGDLWCEACGEAMGLDNVRAWEADYVLSALLPSLTELAVADVGNTLAVDIMGSPVSLEFLRNHAGHKLVAEHR
jgi:hypothetical protein